MYSLRRLHGHRFERLNAIIDGLESHLTSYINLVGSASLPLPQVGLMLGLPATACRVEGHRDARLFPATAPMDLAEVLVEETVAELFGLSPDYAVSAQPHSATQANHAVFQAVLGDGRAVVCGLSPADGGHISHRLGLPASARFVPIPLGDCGELDYEHLAAAVRSDPPALIVAGSTSYTRKLDYERLRQVADHVGAYLHADLAHTAPFVAAGLHGPAFPFVDSATVDTSKSLCGPRGGILIYRRAYAEAVQRAIFPIVQSSPNQNGVLAKAACMSHWVNEGLEPHATRMVRLARILSERLEPAIGPPAYGGTDTHLLLFDVDRVGLDGRQAEEALERTRILVNRNLVPGDHRSPWAPSGIRIGTTVLAIVNYSDDAVRALGDAIASVLTNGDGHDRTVEQLLAAYHRDLVNTSSAPTS